MAAEKRPAEDVQPTPRMKKPRIIYDLITTKNGDAKMSAFVMDYYKKFSRPSNDPCRTLQSLNKNFIARRKKGADGKVTKESNITALSGGSFFIPPENHEGYFVNRAADIKDGHFPPLNEQAKDNPLLAIEIDYRFKDLTTIHSEEIFMNHIRTVHMMVVRYIKDPELRLMLYTCRPKPKFNNDTKSWMVASGFHLLYNRRISTEMGAQITHSCAEDLKKIYEDQSVIDNIYINPRQGTLKPVTQLRPPYSSKKINCFYCNDSELKNPNPKNLNEVNPIIPNCIMCNNSKSCLDVNFYYLKNVYNPLFEIDATFTDMLKRDMILELKMSNIWGLCHPICTTAKPEEIPMYTPEDMRVTPKKPAQPQIQIGPLDVPLPNAPIQATNVNSLLKSFGHINVKQKDDIGKQINLTLDILKAARSLLGRLPHPHYKNTSVSKITVYETSTEKPRRKSSKTPVPSQPSEPKPKRISLSIQLSGEGSTFCMAKNDFHNSNRAQLWLTGNMIYGGCWSKHCRLFACVHAYEDCVLLGYISSMQSACLKQLKIEHS